MTHRRDALVIGGGPAGTSAAILLAHAGWQVSLVEQHGYPRQKVCGECIGAGNLPLLDELGVGEAFRRLAGAPLQQVGWMHGATEVTADMPACQGSAGIYGRALGRDVFDALLLERARMVGVRVWQPARVRRVWGSTGEFTCEIVHLGVPHASYSAKTAETLSASLIVDAHGSWETGPDFKALGESTHRVRQRASDLFAFKATFSQSALALGVLPVLALEGGYGGMVVADGGRTTVALCVRRDVLRALRLRYPGLPAGMAVGSHLRKSCRGVREALREASQDGSWLTVGPLRPGSRLRELPGVFRVGNAAGESHPLVGEGISMALQSSKLLVESLLSHTNKTIDTKALSVSHHAYANAWRKSFLPRMHLAALYAHVAMRTPLAATVGASLRQWPALLTTAARFAGKARPAAQFPPFSEEPI